MEHRQKMPLSSNTVLPQTATEVTLVRIWSALLRCDGVGINDNFFKLGGDSLVAMRAINRLRIVFHLELSMRMLFDYPTIAALARVIDAQVAQRKSEIHTSAHESTPRFMPKCDRGPSF
jgi:aryl carrier-like protein